METKNGKKVIVKARIGNDIVKIDYASEDRNAYSDLEIKGQIQYLGIGQYHSFDEILATATRHIHFWQSSKWIKPKLKKTDAVGTLPTSEFLKKHKRKNINLLKFDIKEVMAHKKLSKTQLIGVLEYITNLGK